MNTASIRRTSTMEELQQAERLIRRWLQAWRDRKDQTAADRIVRQCQPLIGSIVSTFTRYGYEFDDLMAQALLGLTQAMNRFDLSRACSFLGYAKLYVKRCIIDWARANPKGDRANETAAAKEEGSPEPHEDADYAFGVIVFEFLKELPVKESTVFTLHHLKGFSLREIATSAGISVGAAHKYATAAQRKLLDYVADLGAPHERSMKMGGVMA